jgi:parvulin-like peptidyl-prolyl isomerase
MIYMGLGLVAALILIVLAFGLIQTYIIEPNQPVATVNGQEIITADYQDRVRYERFVLENQLQQIIQQVSTLAQPGNEQLAEFLRPQYEQLAQQVQQQLQTVDISTVDLLVEDKLVAEEAARRNLTVSPEEVTEYINRLVARRAGGLTAAAATATATAGIEATATAAVWTPTPTLTPSPTLTATATATTTAGITATTEISPTATPADTPTPAPTPTPNILAESDLATEHAAWISTLNDQAGVDEETYRTIVSTLLLKEKVQEALGDEVPTEAEQARARHILVETEEEAQAVIDRLEAGEDFAEVAEEISKDTFSGAQGGDLGFIPRGQLLAPVDEAIFSLPIGETSEPIESQAGWHVIEVLEREVRELSPGDYSQAQSQAYQDWLNQTRAEADIQNLWTPDMAPEANEPFAALP